MKNKMKEKKSPAGFTDENFHIPHHVQIGGEAELFASVQSALEQAERGEVIQPRSVMYVAPDTMREALVDSRARIMEYVCRVDEVHSIEAMANELNRERSAVSRDVKVLEKIGLLAVQECVHAGHGKRKSIALAHENIEIRLQFEAKKSRPI
ncbi:MAG: hypothetical protein QM533_08825 [Cytophagales bacterium]|nr:hypothetical protein [Cytophagales bacterium]